MSLWSQSLTVDQVSKTVEVNMLKHLDIKIIELGEDYLSATMPVDERTKQPHGLLHGGASCVLIESLGSIASNLVLHNEKKVAVGIEINANHLKSVKTGIVKGIAKPVHLGKKTHVWNIEVFNEQGKLAAIGRLTTMVMDC